MEARGVKLGKDAQEREAIQQERTAPACPAVMLTGDGVILSISTWMAWALAPSGSQTASRVPSGDSLCDLIRRRCDSLAVADLATARHRHLPEALGSNPPAG
jgi:hypothetical protein